MSDGWGRRDRGEEENNRGAHRGARGEIVSFDDVSSRARSGRQNGGGPSIWHRYPSPLTEGSGPTKNRRPPPPIIYRIAGDQNNRGTASFEWIYIGMRDCSDGRIAAATTADGRRGEGAKLWEL